ncbi:MAG: SURF1 family protein [Salinarimonadaceae bacterium]|nr:MAG: SURF1 family protein [Salinarimonadaceae bacterium]
MTVGTTEKGPKDAPRRSRRALVAAAAATLVSLAILIALGTWQMQRLAWKEGVVARIEERARAEPTAPLAESDWRSFAPEAHEYTRVRIAGTFEHEAEVLVYALAPTRTRGQPLQGFAVMTPLLLEDGARILVNRGFVPTQMRDPDARPAPPPEGVVEIVGLVRAPERRTLFVPENIPADEQWMTRDLGEIAGARGLDRVAPFWIDAESDPAAPEWPRAGASVLDPPNNHLQYALTWYGLALVLAVVFVLYARGRMRRGG